MCDNCALSSLSMTDMMVMTVVMETTMILIVVPATETFANDKGNDGDDD